MKTRTIYVRSDNQQPGLWLWVLWQEEDFRDIDGGCAGKNRTILDACDASFNTRKQAVRAALTRLKPDTRMEVEPEVEPEVESE